MASNIGWLRGPDGKPGDTWNPTIGCSRKSPGCDHCYAIIESHMHAGHPNPKISAAFQGVTAMTENGPDWTGRVNLLHDRLDKPLHWRRPRYVFVNSLSDLFHRGIPIEFIAEIFAVMLVAERHVFIALTKEHARMRAVLCDPAFADMVFKIAVEKYGMDPERDRARWWPVPNLILGVSVEDQHWADIRIPYLLDAPAAYRALSVEPLVGPLKLDMADWAPPHMRGYPGVHNPLTGEWWPACGDADAESRNRVIEQPRLDVVMVGGESGVDARIMEEEWLRGVVRQCRPHGVKVFAKQLGTVLAARYGLSSKKGAEIGEWPEHLADVAVQEMPVAPGVAA